MGGLKPSGSRRQAILEAAEDLLAEGGYSALSIRALAPRAGMSLGLLYYYFADKHAVFEALMQDYQRRMTAFLDEFPRSEGLTALLQAIVPVAARQWARVGRVVAVWRAERTDDSPELRARRVGAAAAQFSALRKALAETAQAESLPLRPDPEIVPFVWSGLMGLADLLAQGWVEEIDWDRLAELTVTSITNQIVDSPGQEPEHAHP